MRALLNRVRVVNKSLQEYACRHEGDLGDTLGAATLHANMEANPLPDSLSELSRYSNMS
jgi:hypothetical protein